MQFAQGLLDDGPLDGAGQVPGGQVGVDDLEIAVHRQIEWDIGIALHQLPDAIGPGANGEGQLVGIAVAQGVKELQGGIQSTLLQQPRQVAVDGRGVYGHR
jgi:hypothetical protein